MKHKSINVAGFLFPTTSGDLRQSVLLCLLAAGTALATAGCGSDGPRPVNPKQVVPVSGIVLVDGEPERGVKIRLVPDPLPADGKVALPTIGRTDAEGKFQFTSYYQNDGAPIGDFGLLFEWHQNPASSSNTDYFKGALMDRLNPRHKLSVKGDEGSIDMGVLEIP